MSKVLSKLQTIPTEKKLQNTFSILLNVFCSQLWAKMKSLSKLTAAFDSVTCSHDMKLISRWGNMIVYTVLEG